MTSSEDKQGEGFQRTRKALEQLFGPLSDREIRCAVMAYNDAGIHAARSSCADINYAIGIGLSNIESTIRDMREALQSAVPESGRTESGWTPIQQINAAGPETVGGSIAKPSGPEDFAISPAAPSTPQPGAPTPRTEREALLLAAISTAAGQNTRESAKQRIGRDNPYWTPAYEDVCAAVDREMALREQLEAARSASALSVRVVKGSGSWGYGVVLRDGGPFVWSFEGPNAEEAATMLADGLRRQLAALSATAPSGSDNSPRGDK